MMKPELRDELDRFARLSARELAETYVKKTRIFERMREFMARHEFYVLPVTQVHPFAVDLPWPKTFLGQNARSYIDWMKSCWAISVTGQPALSVPCGFSAEGLPIGMQIVGRYGDDWGLLQLGHAFEAATGYGKRRPPVAA